MKVLIISLLVLIWILLGLSAVSKQIKQDADGVKCIKRSLLYLGIIIAGPITLIGKK